MLPYLTYCSHYDPLCLLAISITLKIDPTGLTHIELVYPESDEKLQQQIKDTTNRLKNVQEKFDEEMLNINESIQIIHWKLNI